MLYFIDGKVQIFCPRFQGNLFPLREHFQYQSIVIRTTHNSLCFQMQLPFHQILIDCVCKHANANFSGGDLFSQNASWLYAACEPWSRTVHGLVFLLVVSH